MLEDGPPRPRRGQRRPRPARWLGLVLGLAAIVVALVVVTHRAASSADSADAFAAPAPSALASMSLRQRIVAIATSQLGYSTDPADSYCNKYSAYWHVGAPGCPDGDRSEEWCADFAAWTWRLAGVKFGYGYNPGELDSSAASFYVWGLRHGTWHPASSRYRPQPGDVAVYGLNQSSLTAVHVAVVTGLSPGSAYPNVVNGDGDRTGHSKVETGRHQYEAQASNGNSTLSGYVSP